MSEEEEIHDRGRLRTIASNIKRAPPCAMAGQRLTFSLEPAFEPAARRGSGTKVVFLEYIAIAARCGMAHDQSSRQDRP